MDDFGAPGTLPQLARKRRRSVDQIAEYRERASKKHADVLSESLADAADAAASELGATPDGEIDTRLENEQARIDDRDFGEYVADHVYDETIKGAQYPGPMRRVDVSRARERDRARRGGDSSLTMHHTNHHDPFGFSYTQEQRSQSLSNRDP